LEGQERIVCALQKAKPAIREGNRNPLGLELLSAAAERGNYPEAKPNRDGLKGRPACKDAELYRSFDTTPMTERSLTQIGPLRIAALQTEWKQNDGNVCGIQRIRAAYNGFAKLVAVAFRPESEPTCAIQIDSCGLRSSGFAVPVCVCSASVSADDGVPRESQITTGRFWNCKNAPGMPA
jgi:hypothetical protein